MDTSILCWPFWLCIQNDSRQAQRWEDDLIAWTWREYADQYEEDPDTADPEIILRMPMVKVGALGKKATIHQLTTILYTSKMSYFQVITTC